MTPSPDTLLCARSVLELLPQPVVIVSAPDLRVAYLNRAQREWLSGCGVEAPEALVGQSVETLRDGLCQSLLEACREVRDTARPVELRGVRRQVCSEVSYWDVSLAPALGPENRVSFVTRVATDMTAREQSAVEGMGQESLLRALVDAIPEQIYVKDAQGRFLAANEAVATANNLPSWQGIIGKTDFDLFPLELAEAYWAEEQELLRTGLPIMDQRRLGPDGERQSHWIITKVPLRDSSGKPIGIVGINWDVTQLRRAEDALREAHALLDAIVRASPLPLVALAVDGSVTLWNPAAEAVFGWSSDEVVGRPLPTQTDAVEEQVQAYQGPMLRGESLRGLEVASRRKDGSTVDVRLWTAPIHDAQGQVAGTIGVFEDITQEKRAREERERFQERLQQTQRLESLGVLAGGIAHDFNNLLTGVLGNASLVLAELPAGSSLRPRLQAVETAARRAAQLTSQMLSYSGGGRFVVEPVDLSEVVREMVHLLGSSISKKARLELDLPVGLPGVQGDAGQIRQVVMNLITNASEALGDAPGRIRVRSGTLHADAGFLASTYLYDGQPEGRYVYVEVSDTGCGMDEATRSRLFEPFFTTKFTGRGLGMSAVLGILRSHRGAIRVESEPGRGSTFLVLLPAAEDQPARPPERLAAQPEEPITGTVLVVDDEEAVRAVARDLLAAAGFQVLTARDGREAVEILQEQREAISAVLLDLTMPEMDGIETAREILSLAPRVRILLSSGYAEPERSEIDLGGAGIAGFVRKPYTLQGLREAIRLVLRPRG